MAFFDRLRRFFTPKEERQILQPKEEPKQRWLTRLQNFFRPKEEKQILEPKEEPLPIRRLNMLINIIEVLERIKKACEKQTTCEGCPFSATYRHKGECTDIYYCKIADTPSDWQIDSGYNDEILLDVSDLQRYYKVEE